MDPFGPSATLDTPGTIDSGEPQTEQRSFVDGYAIALVIGLGLFTVPTLESAQWAPRAAALLTAVGIGLPLLVLQAWRGHRPSVAGVGFLAVAGLSTALSDHPASSLTGYYNIGTGAVYVGALVSVAAIGAALSERGRKDLGRALMVVLAVNVTVAAFAQHFDLTSARISQPGARSTGLLGNAVHFSALGAGAVALAAWHVGQRRWRYTAVAAVGSAAIQMSGSRGALLGVTGAIVALAVTRRFRAAGAVTAAVIVGVLLTLALGLGQSVTGRLGGDVRDVTSGSAGAGGYTARLDVWSSAGDSIRSNVLTGRGPGLFRDAITANRSVRETLYTGPDVYYHDAHNLFVEYLTTTGVIGLAGLLTWLVIHIKRGRGWFLWFALAVLAVYQLQPQNNTLLPMAVLALGAAGPRVETAFSPAIASARWVAAALAAVLAATLIYGEVQLTTCELDGDVAAGERAARLFPMWQQPATCVANAHEFFAYGVEDRSRIPDLNRWRQEAIRREPQHPRLWARAGHDYFVEPDIPKARASFDAALALDPKSAFALFGAAKVAGREGRWSDAVAYLTRAREVAPDDRLIHSMLIVAVRRERAGAGPALPRDTPPDPRTPITER